MDDRNLHALRNLLSRTAMRNDDHVGVPYKEDLLILAVKVFKGQVRPTPELTETLMQNLIYYLAKDLVECEEESRILGEIE